jgi:hypothetical protein
LNIQFGGRMPRRIFKCGNFLPLLKSGKDLNNQVLLSWPSSAGNYGLQTTTNLVSSGSWAAVANAPTTNGSTITVTLPLTRTNQFFRLYNP